MPPSMPKTPQQPRLNPNPKWPLWIEPVPHQPEPVSAPPSGDDVMPYINGGYYPT